MTALTSHSLGAPVQFPINPVVLLERQAKHPPVANIDRRLLYQYSGTDVVGNDIAAWQESATRTGKPDPRPFERSGWILGYAVSGDFVSGNLRSAADADEDPAASILLDSIPRVLSSRGGPETYLAAAPNRNGNATSIIARNLAFGNFHRSALNGNAMECVILNRAFIHNSVAALEKDPIPSTRYHQAVDQSANTRHIDNIVARVESEYRSTQRRVSDQSHIVLRYHDILATGS